MKICRYGEEGKEKVGLIDSNGAIRSLEEHVTTLDGRALAAGILDRLASVDAETLPLVEGRPRLGTPWQGISKFICIGLNYSDHAAEAGMKVPDSPIIFLKAPSAVCGPNDDTIQPRGSTKLDWEVELAVVIGREANDVSEDEAPEHIAGFCVANDISERAFQMESGQWDKGKGCDTFGPLGPWLVTKDEIGSPQDLELWLDVNGQRMQTGNTRTMVFGVNRLVAECSRYMTLKPGDVIATGTPPGVGMGIKPDPMWLTPGDVVELGISGLGVQRQKVVQRS